MFASHIFTKKQIVVKVIGTTFQNIKPKKVKKIWKFALIYNNKFNKD